MVGEHDACANAASHEPCLVLSPIQGIGMVHRSPQGGDMRQPRAPRPGFRSNHGFPALSGRQGVIPYRPLVQRGLVETIPTRCRPVRAREYVGDQFPGPCPGLSHPTPLGLVEKPSRCSHPGSRSVSRSLLIRGLPMNRETPAPEGRSERSARAKTRAFRQYPSQRVRFCRPSGAPNPLERLTHGSRHVLPFFRPSGPSVAAGVSPPL
jgi:hypothetical protein